jgi:hypothetical protein
MSPSHVVVDGSNIATEGRSTPSLQQLDDAIRQFQAEFPDTEVIVVVDATFGHRIEPGERAEFDEAVAHGELVSPPAGAIGRGDAFVLRVAERVGAQVLSNDSFQEFHAEHPWLFDEGRLMGGKPIPGVGWIFTPRLPVRGQRSRLATSPGSGRSRRAPTDDAPSTKPARARRTSKVAADAIALATAEASGAPVTKATKETSKPATGAKAAKAAKTDQTTPTAKAAKAANPAKAAKTAKTTKTAKVAKGTKTAAKETKATRAAGTTAGRAGQKRSASGGKVAKEQAKPGESAKPAKTATVAKAANAAKPAKAAAAAVAVAPIAVASEAVAKKSSASRRGRRGRGSAAPVVRAAIEAATEEALGVPGSEAASAPREAAKGRRQARATPASPASPAAINDPLTFLTFVSEHPLGSTVVGTVSSFVSHGAMVDVDGMSCYLPLTGLGDPAPRRAREVVDRGEERSFVVVALDPPRRGAELALPEMARSTTPEPVAPVEGSSGRTRRAGRAAS